MITARRAIDSCLPRMPRHSSSTARDLSWRVHLVSIVLIVVFASRAASTTGTGPLTVSTLHASNSVIDMTVDSQGRLLTVDYSSNGYYMYRILPNGTRTTLARGLNTPFGITTDVTTSIAYVTDTYNSCIKSVSSSGTNTTIAGTCGPSAVLIELNARMQGDVPRSSSLVGYDQYTVLAYLCKYIGTLHLLGDRETTAWSNALRGVFPPLYPARESNRVTRSVLFLRVENDGVIAEPGRRFLTQ